MILWYSLIYELELQTRIKIKTPKFIVTDLPTIYKMLYDSSY